MPAGGVSDTLLGKLAWRALGAAGPVDPLALYIPLTLQHLAVDILSTHRVTTVGVESAGVREARARVHGSRSIIDDETPPAARLRLAAAWRQRLAPGRCTGAGRGCVRVRVAWQRDDVRQAGSPRRAARRARAQSWHLAQAPAARPCTAKV